MSEQEHRPGPDNQEGLDSSLERLGDSAAQAEQLLAYAKELAGSNAHTRRIEEVAQGLLWQLRKRDGQIEGSSTHYDAVEQNVQTLLQRRKYKEALQTLESTVMWRHITERIQHYSGCDRNTVLRVLMALIANTQDKASFFFGDDEAQELIAIRTTTQAVGNTLLQTMSGLARADITSPTDPYQLRTALIELLCPDSQAEDLHQATDIYLSQNYEVLRAEVLQRTRQATATTEPMTPESAAVALVPPTQPSPTQPPRSQPQPAKIQSTAEARPAQPEQRQLEERLAQTEQRQERRLRPRARRARQSINRRLGASAKQVALATLLGGTLVAGVNWYREQQAERTPYKIKVDASLRPFQEAYETVPAEPIHFERKQIVEDQDFIYPGSILYTADILQRASQLQRELAAGRYQSAKEKERVQHTLQLLASAKKQEPQAVVFRVVEQDGILHIKPLLETRNVEIKKKVQTELLIVGGELEAIVTAMRAAKLGESVTLLYEEGQLANLNSDKGANLAYFDGVRNKNVEPPAELLELFQEALGMEPDNIISIPNANLHQKLLIYLKQKYPQIRLIPIDDLNALRVTDPFANQKEVITAGGLAITAQRVIDMDPEAILTEKCIGERFITEIDYETANLSYGLVFDLERLNKETLRQLEQIHPDEIVKSFGLTSDRITAWPEVHAAYVRCLQAYREKTHRFKRFHWGYDNMAAAYILYARILARTAPDHIKPVLNQLNRIRSVDHFNVALHDNRATFNSLSYHLPKRLHQGDHLLGSNRYLKMIKEYEGRILKHFIKIFSSETVQVHLPQELYVRQQTSWMPTRHPRLFKTLQCDPPNRPPTETFKYEYDTRLVEPRDKHDEAYRLIKQREGVCDKRAVFITTDPRRTATNYPNFYAINKNSQSKETHPTARIQQFMAMEGVQLVEWLHKQDK